MDKITKVLLATEKPFEQDARDAAIKIMRDGGLEVFVLESYKKDQLLAALPGANGLIVRSDEVTPDFIDAAPDLKLIVRAGAGYDTIDHIYAEQKGITVENTPGVNSNAVAEMAIELSSLALRPLNGKKGRELAGKTLGILGFGNIGKLVAKRLRGYEMNLRAYDEIPINPERARDLGVLVARSMDELFASADIVSLHVPFNDSTKGGIDYRLMALMKDDGVLVNTARAGIINEEDLVRILEERPSFRYASDFQLVRSTIPEKIRDQIIATPKKQGAETPEANYAAATTAARVMVEGLVQGKFPYPINNPLPPELIEYTTLAQYLGRFNTTFVRNPNRVQIICYKDLNKYRELLVQYVLKGLFQDELGKKLTPSEALEAAKERGIEVCCHPEPDDSRGHGNAITIDYFAEGTHRHNIRGRVDERELQINRVGSSKIEIPLVPGVFLVAEYDEQPGIFDRMGRAFSSKGYNKVDGGFRQSPDGKSAVAFCRIETKECGFEGLYAILEREIRTMSGVHYAHLVDMR